MNVIDRKVFIAIPQGELARYSDFDATLDTVILPPHTVKQRIFGIYIANLQNELARLFLQTDCEYFWLLNDDQLYPSDTLMNLLERNVDVVVPLCVEKAAPHGPLIYDAGVNGFNPYRCLRKGEQGLIEVGACGGGGMLVHRRVFEALNDPWWTVTEKRHANGKIEYSSEDFDFCARVREAGFRIHCDLDLSVVHVAHYGLRAMRDQSGEWFTALIRGQEMIAIPAAVPAEEPVSV